MGSVLLEGFDLEKDALLLKKQRIQVCMPLTYSYKVLYYILWHFISVPRLAPEN
ncbi:hypothetical protein SAMN05421677_12411 [Halobacillus aidingensis]|uniref:Uncharacterized protein n=1 Tax=Halobacillus aidingensis TaxID=240303 RepID=A0A1H0U3V2_HALAD|nr:hypothetical protein SAMN05421677_12411 [Halobacillus aidingensis]